MRRQERMMSNMTALKVVGRVPCYKNDDEEFYSNETREICAEISIPDGVLIVDLALSSEENAVYDEDAPRLWIHWGRSGWTIEVHKDDGAPFLEVRLIGSFTETIVKRGFDNKIVDKRKIDER